MNKLALCLPLFALGCAQASPSETPAAPKAAKPASAPAETAPSVPAEAKTALPTAPARGKDDDRKSKNGSLEATVGGVSLVVQYGRPLVSGRKIFGELVPFGELWRTGADEATTISLGSDAMIAGQKVARGTYALFTVPGEKGWKVVLNSQAQQWGAYKHDAAKDVLTAEVSAAAHDNTEALTFAATDDAIQLMWADVSVTIPVAQTK